MQDNGEASEINRSGSFKNADGPALSRSNSNASDASRKPASINYYDDFWLSEQLKYDGSLCKFCNITNSRYQRTANPGNKK